MGGSGNGDDGGLEWWDGTYDWVDIIEWRWGTRSGKYFIGWLAELKWIAGAGKETLVWLGARVLVMGSCDRFGGGAEALLNWGGGWKPDGWYTGGDFESVSGYSQGRTSMFGDCRPSFSSTSRDRDSRESVSKVGSRRL